MLLRRCLFSRAQESHCLKYTYIQPIQLDWGLQPANVLSHHHTFGLTNSSPYHVNTMKILLQSWNINADPRKWCSVHWTTTTATTSSENHINSYWNHINLSYLLVDIPSFNKKTGKSKGNNRVIIFSYIDTKTSKTTVTIISFQSVFTKLWEKL